MYDRVILDQDYSRAHYFAFKFSGEPVVAVATAVQPEIDFVGNSVGALNDLEAVCTPVGFAILPMTEDSSVCILSWLGEVPGAEELARSFAELADGEIVNAALRFAVEFSENTFWSSTWWDSLGEAQQLGIRQRLTRSAMPGASRPKDALVADGHHWVTHTAEERTRA